MLESIDICLDLNSVYVAEVETLIRDPSHLSCQFLILEKSAALSDTHLPSEVQRYINVHLGLNSADSDLVKEFVEFL